ncbi:unnamed protein product [Vicia faba]|uniref:Uncharacterized protein n=1 Tax=Vicia faba TaxID=3906 RepID=A0AAV1AW60_VICFA|nr:unnamed protein product [Vicia faba]
MSTFALGRLAQDSHNQAGIAYNGGIEPLLNLLVTNNPSVQHNAAFALYALADNERRRLKKPVPAVETRLKIRIKTTAGRPPPVVINEPTEHEVIAKINNPSESDNSSSSAEIPVQDTAGTSKRIPTPVEDYDTFLNSEGDPTYRPTSVKGSFMSSADEVNQTSEPQHETIKEADEEEAVGNQEVTRVPLVDVQENEEESIPVAETEIERENVEIQEADGEEGFAEGNKILQALKQFQISLHKESQYQGKAQRRNLEELKSYKN